MLFSEFLQAISLVLLSAYYKFLGGFPLVAVAALLLYVGCYQVMLWSFEDLEFSTQFLSIINMRNAEKKKKKMKEKEFSI